MSRRRGSLAFAVERSPAAPQTTPYDVNSEAGVQVIRIHSRTARWVQVSVSRRHHGLSFTVLSRVSSAVAPAHSSSFGSGEASVGYA